MNYWIYLVIAILLEVTGVTFMKLSQGFSKMLPSIFIFIFYGLSLTLLTLALKKIDIGVAYAIWAGLGTAFVAIIGIYIFKESWSLMKILSILMIIAGVIGLNLSEGIDFGNESSQQVQFFKKH